MMAIDLFYIAINDTWCAIVLIPITSLNCAPGTSFNATLPTGFVLVASHQSRRSENALAGFCIAIAVALRCATFVAVLAITLAIVDQALYATPLPTSRVPEWLAYSGFTYEYLLPGLPTYSLVPETWNYTYFILFIWFVESIICTSVVLFYTGITIRSAFPALPVLVGFLGQFIVLQLPQLFADLTFFLDPAVAAGVPVRGVVVDALCLETYAWGGLFQTGVGGPALLHGQRTSSRSMKWPRSRCRAFSADTALTALPRSSEWSLRSLSSLLHASPNGTRYEEHARFRNMPPRPKGEPAHDDHARIILHGPTPRFPGNVNEAERPVRHVSIKTSPRKHLV